MESLYLVLVVTAFVQQAAPTTERAGDVYDVQYESTTKGQTDTGSSSVRSRNALVERVVRIRDDGIELVFNLPENATEADRLREWQFPARVLKAEGEPFRLLNEDEIAQRNIAWREAADIPEEYCGRWYFTWNAFKVECDPTSVLETLAPFDLGRDELRAGDVYRDPAAMKAVLLRSNDQKLIAEMQVDPTVVREAREEEDRITAEIMGPQYDAFGAYEKPTIEEVNGVISVVFELDADGGVIARDRIAQIDVANDDGSQEQRTTNETVTKVRRPR